MFCIAAFIVLVIISIFSARYRRMAKQAWGCVARRLTLRPCDTTFKEQLKSKLLAHVALKKPRLLKAANIGIEVAAFLVVALTVWSLYVVVKSGLNLYVYNTCNPTNAASCSIGAEACSIETVKPSFVTSVKEFKLHTWVANEVSSFGQTLAAVPTRMQSWKAENYLPANATYLRPYDAAKPLAVEAIDPGCQFCKELYRNQKQANFADRYNLTYIAYPIKDPRNANGYKFKNSLLVTRYLEAVKLNPLDGAATPADWQILERLFTWSDEKGIEYQLKVNMLLNETEAKALLESWLRQIGYDDARLKTVVATADSQQVTDIIDSNRKIVEDKIKTVKIPTMIFEGRRHNGVLSVEKLR